MKGFLTVVLLVIMTAMLSGCETINIAAQENVIVPKEKTVLFNGKDFTGWKMKHRGEPVDPNTIWSVKDGVLRCTGDENHRGYIRTKEKY